MLNEILQNKNLNLPKLAELTGISERYLEALIEEKFDKLPPAPYVRGYIFKLAEVLDLDGEKVWQEYQKNRQLKKSGSFDFLPLNRFAPRAINKKWIFASVILLLFAGYIVLRYDFFLGKPRLTLTGEIINSVRPMVEQTPFTVEGSIEPGDQLTINQEEIYPAPDGYFKKEISLQPGLNIIQFRVKRFLGREISVIKEILYLPKN